MFAPPPVSTNQNGLRETNFFQNCENIAQDKHTSIRIHLLNYQYAECTGDVLTPLPQRVFQLYQPFLHPLATNDQFVLQPTNKRVRQNVMLLSLYLRWEAKDKTPHPDSQTYSRTVCSKAHSRSLPTHHRSVTPDLVILSVNGNVVPKNVTVLIYGNLVPTPCTHSFPTFQSNNIQLQLEKT